MIVSNQALDSEGTDRAVNISFLFDFRFCSKMLLGGSLTVRRQTLRPQSIFFEIKKLSGHVKVKHFKASLERTSLY